MAGFMSRMMMVANLILLMLVLIFSYHPPKYIFEYIPGELLSYLDRTLFCVETIKVPVSSDLKLLDQNNFGEKLALVMPFTGHDYKELIKNLNSTWKTFSPCSKAHNYQEFKDLIFYFHKSYELLPQNGLQKLKQLANFDSIRRCFRKIRFMSADLTDLEDKYPLGPSNMFFKLFHTSLPKEYGSLFWMEPDVFACRSNWLNRLYEEFALDTEFWVKGSILMNSSHVPKGELYKDYTFSRHINGNALYRIGNPEFVQWVLNEVETSFRKSPETYLWSWDIAFELIRNSWVSEMQWEDYAKTTTRFKYSNLIHNYYRAEVDLKQICSLNRNTYLLHGRNVKVD